MITDALAGRATSMAYGKGFPRQFIHVDDVAAAVVAALFGKSASGRAFNLSDGERRTLGEVAGIVRSLLPGAKVELDEGDDPDDDYVGRLDLSEAREHLGWGPAVGLEAGIRSYVAHLAGTGG